MGCTGWEQHEDKWCRGLDHLEKFQRMDCQVELAYSINSYGNRL